MMRWKLPWDALKMPNQVSSNGTTLGTGSY